MKRRVLSLALALSLLLAMLPGGSLSAAEEQLVPVEIEEPAAASEEVIEEPTVAEEAQDDPPSAEEPPVEPAEEPAEEIVEEPEVTAAPEEAQPDAATPEPPEEEHPVFEMPVEELVEEEPALFADIEEEAESVDLRSVPALGSDGVEYAGVAYLSQAAFNSLSEAQQEDYVQMVDYLTDMLDCGMTVEHPVFSLDEDGVLSFDYSVPLAFFADDAEPVESEAVISEIVEEPVPAEEVVEEVAVEGAPEAAEVPEAAEPEGPIVENVELAEQYRVPIERIPGWRSPSSGTANIFGASVQNFNTLYYDGKDIFYDQLDSVEKTFFETARESIIEGGRNGFTIAANSSISTVSVSNAFSALMQTYPEMFDWMSTDGGWGVSAQVTPDGRVEKNVALDISQYYSAALEREAQAKVDSIVSAAVKDAQANYPNDLDYGIVKYLDAWLCEHSYYNDYGTYLSQKSTEEYYYCHRSYGALLKGYSVCESYALSMSRMLDAAGIPNIYVVGYAYQDKDAGHAWNYVYLSDGKYYLQDTTWNDSTNPNQTISDESHLLCANDTDHTPTGKRFIGDDLKTFDFPNISETKYVPRSQSSATPRITPEPTMHPVLDSVKVEKIELSDTKLMMAPNGWDQLAVKLSPEGIAYEPLKWESSNPDLVTCSRGSLNAKATTGTAVITCSVLSNPSVKATCTVTVTDGNIPVTRVELSDTELTLKPGERAPISISVRPYCAPTRSFFPISSKSSVAQFEQDENSNCYIVAKGVGETDFSFEAAANREIKAVCHVTVIDEDAPVPVSRIELSSPQLALEKGQSAVLTATVSPQNAENKTLKWTSTADTVATVEGGTVHAIGPGRATIRCEATDGSNVYAECQVTVSSKKVKTITLSQNQLTMIKGGSATLTATVSPDDADNKELRWTSTADGVATVTGGEVQAVGPGQATIRCAATDGSGVYAECQVTVDPIKVSTITLSQNELTLTKGDTETLTADVGPEDADNKAVTWSSNMGTVATVDGGVVKAVGPGQATIRCEAADGSGIFAECRVTVNPLKISTITLSPGELTLARGMSVTLTAIIDPEDADNQELEWESDDRDVATVENGQVTAGDKLGQATITCKATDGSGAQATCEVEVVDLLPDSISLSPSSLTLGANGGRAQLEVIPWPEGAATGKVTYSSNKPKVADVRDDGIVTAGSKTGTATITAVTANGKSATCTITVKPAPSRVTLDKGELELSVGEKLSEKLKAKLSDGSASTLKWTSSAPGVATVDESGNVTAVSAGDATITVKAHNYDPEKPDDSANKKLTASCAVKVWPDPATISGLPKKVALGKKEKLQLAPVAKDEDGEDTYAEFSYESSNPDVAAVDAANGKITAKSPSEEPVTITVRTKNGTSKTVEVAVKAAPVKADLTLSETSRTLGIDESFELTATLAEGKASNKLTATSSDKKIAAVKEVAPGKFEVTTNAANQKTGTAKITIRTFNDISKTCTVTVKKTPTDAEGMLKIEPAELTLAMGQTATLTAKYKSGFGGSVKWSVVNGEGGGEATIENGVLTPVQAGTVTVRATSYNDAAFAEREVTIEPAPETVEIENVEEESITLGKGETLTLAPVAKSADGKPVTAATFTYESNQPSVVSTNNKKGRIKAEAPGEAKITVKSHNEKSAEFKVVVKAAPTKVTIANNPKTLGKNEPWTLIATPARKDGADCAGGVTFKSSNTNVLEVDPNTGELTAKKPGKSAKITAKAYNGKSTSVTIKVKAEPTEIKLSDTALTLGVKETATLTASFGSTSEYGHVSWESDDSETVSVEDGVLTALAEGTATITASVYHDGSEEPFQAECEVTVLPEPAKLTLDVTEATLGVKEPLTLAPGVTDAKGEATHATLTFKSSKKGVAAVNASGKITPKKAGTATITVTAHNYEEGKPDLKAECVITVKSAPSKVTLSAKAKTLGVDESFTLKATLPKNTAASLTATSNLNEVATVAEGTNPGEYIVTAKSIGTAKIKVEAHNGVSAKCTVTVKAAPESAKLSAESLVLGAQDGAKLQVTFEPEDAFANVTWESDAPEIATVSDDGAVKAVSKGEAKITARVYNQEALTCTVTVKNEPTAENTTLQLTPAKSKIGVGESVTILPAFGEDVFGSVKSYKSSNTTVATVSAKGVIRGKAKGETTITVKMHNNVKLTQKVTVAAAPTGLAITNLPEDDALTLTAGGTWTPEFEISGYGGSDPTGVVNAFASSDPSVAEFEDGVLTAKAPGTTTITCETYNGKSASFTLTVNAAE